MNRTRRTWGCKDIWKLLWWSKWQWKYSRRVCPPSKAIWLLKKNMSVQQLK